MEIQKGIVVGLIIVVFLIIVAALWARGEEKKLWNGGFCSECRVHWTRFGTDSQGGRGYKCTCVPVRRIWISYAVDKARMS